MHIFLYIYLSIIRLNRALEDTNKLRGELSAAEREKKEAKVESMKNFAF